MSEPGTEDDVAPGEGDAFMRRAIELSRQGMEGAGPPFGAVVVRDGRVVAEGYNDSFVTNDPTAYGLMPRSWRSAVPAR